MGFGTLYTQSFAISAWCYLDVNSMRLVDYQDMDMAKPSFPCSLEKRSRAMTLVVIVSCAKALLPSECSFLLYFTWTS